MFKQQYDDYLGLVEEYLRSLPFEENQLGKSMNYSLIGGGKRVRPVLVLACVEIVGGQAKDFIRAAAAIELIHTYSLIHDDLPCMDNDDYRRGKLSSHKMFGEAAAVLAGDALLTYSFEALAQPLPVSQQRQLRGIQEIAQAAGWQGMVGGQVLDTFGNQKSITLSEIEKVHSLKTGALLKASARLGAILGGGSEEEIEILSKYALALGLAFQIQDDILDVVGESSVLGKSAGSDEKLGKPTYPSLLGLEGAVEHLKNTVEIAKKCLVGFGQKAWFLSKLADYVAERNN